MIYVSLAILLVLGVIFLYLILPSRPTPRPIRPLFPFPNTRPSVSSVTVTIARPGWVLRVATFVVAVLILIEVY
jgi:hypothetical protein